MKVLVVQKKSSYQRLVREKRSRRVGRLLEIDDPSVARMRQSHESHLATVEAAKRHLKSLGAEATYAYVDDDVDACSFELVVTLGGDGTLLAASHGVGAATPTLAINTSPQTSVGYFCAGAPDSLEDTLQAGLGGKLKVTNLTRMEVEVDGKVLTSRVLNDILFSASSPAETTRYLLYHRKQVEDQKSSGIWVGPAAGSTAAQRSAGGRVLPIGSQRLQYVVREPYHGDARPYQLTKGLIEAGEELRLKSKTPGGRLWLDGPHREREASLGADVRLRRSRESLRILGLRRHDKARPAVDPRQD